MGTCLPQEVLWIISSVNACRQASQNLGHLVLSHTRGKTPAKRHFSAKPWQIRNLSLHTKTWCAFCHAPNIKKCCFPIKTAYSSRKIDKHVCASRLNTMLTKHAFLYFLYSKYRLYISLPLLIAQYCHGFHQVVIDFTTCHWFHKIVVDFTMLSRNFTQVQRCRNKDIARTQQVKHVEGQQKGCWEGRTKNAKKNTANRNRNLPKSDPKIKRMFVEKHVILHSWLSKSSRLYWQWLCISNISIIYLV